MLDHKQSPWTTAPYPHYMIAALKMLTRRAYIEGEHDAARFLLDTLVNDTPISENEVAAFQREVIGSLRQAQQRKPAKPDDNGDGIGVFPNKPKPTSPAPSAKQVAW